MATTIITKFGSGAPTASDVVRGELAVDTENGRLYTENIAGSVVEIGLNPSGNVDVTGTVTADGSFNATSAGSYPSFRGAGNYGGGIGFIDTNVSGMYTDTSGANLKFFTNQSASDAAQDKVAMTIDGSGNVGIGTSSIDFYSNTYKGLMVDGGTGPSTVQLVNNDTGSGNSTGGVLCYSLGLLVTYGTHKMMG